MTAHAGIHPDVQSNFRADLWDRRDPLRGGFLGALVLHAALLGGLGISTWVAAHRDTFGAKDAGGMAVGIEAVNSIPLVHHGAQNPLTNDTESEVPQQPVTKPQDRVKEEKPPPDAIPLKARKLKKPTAPEPSERQKFRPYNELEPNQLLSKSAPQISNPMFTAMPGSGNIGAGKNSLQGTIYSGYGDQVQQIIARSWHTSDVDPGIRSAPIVIVTFDLMRDGSVTHLQLTKRSENLSLDNSVKRAVMDPPLPPLPPGFPRDHASFEFSFELKR